MQHINTSISATSLNSWNSAASSSAPIEVDPYLDLIEIFDHTLRTTGPALLFERPALIVIPASGADGVRSQGFQP